MATALELFQKEQAQLQSTQGEISSLLRNAQRRRLEAERARNNRTFSGLPNLQGNAGSGGSQQGDPNALNPADRPTSPEAQQAINNNANSVDQQAVSVSGNANNQKIDIKLNSTQAAELIRSSGAKTAAQKAIFLNKIENPDIRNMLLESNKLQLVDEQIAQAKQNELSAQKSKLIKQKAIQEAGQPAQSAIVQTGQNSFSNLPNAQGQTVIPGQPAILPQQQQIQQNKNGQALKLLDVKNEQALKLLNVKNEQKLNELLLQKPGEKSPKGAKTDKPLTKGQRFDRDVKIELEALKQDSIFKGKSDSELRRIARERVTASSSTAIIKGREKNTNILLNDMRATTQAVQAKKISLDLQADILDSPNFDVSAIGSIKNEIGRYLTAFGIDVSNFGFNDASLNAIFNNQTFKNLMEQLRLQKGVQTEGDAERALKTFATLDTSTKESAQFIVNYMRSIATRNLMRTNFYSKAIEAAGGSISPSEQAKIQNQFIETLKDTPVFVNIPQQDGSVKPLTFAGYRDKIVKQVREANKGNKKKKIGIDEVAILGQWKQLFADNPS